MPFACSAFENIVADVEVLGTSRFPDIPPSHHGVSVPRVGAGYQANLCAAMRTRSDFVAVFRRAHRLLLNRNSRNSSIGCRSSPAAI